MSIILFTADDVHQFFSNFTLALFILFFKAKGKGCRNKKDKHYLILRPLPDAATSSTPLLLLKLLILRSREHL
jgi:hypothetical protein